MANAEHLAILKRGVQQWNQWRANHWAKEQISVKPDLCRAGLRGADLRGADLQEADLTTADLQEADLTTADLRAANLSAADLGEARLIRANLSGADLGKARLFRANLHRATLSRTTLIRSRLVEATLSWANLSGADLNGADLIGANLSWADLSGANLTQANLERAILVHTRLDAADLTGAFIFGISAWDLSLEGTVQKNLVIQGSEDDTPITLDDLEVAQFIYLLLNNQRVRKVIDTITSKMVLILGRFTQERKAILDALRDELRRRDYLPVLFDFEKPSHRDLTETVSTLAHMARFVIADITDARVFRKNWKESCRACRRFPFSRCSSHHSMSTACSSISVATRGCWSRSCTRIRIGCWR